MTLENPTSSLFPIPMPTTMAGLKPLHELLSLEQEPFLLHDYILHRRRQLNLPLSKPKLRDFHFSHQYDFCLKRMRFLGSHDPKKSPLFEFPSTGAPPRSPRLQNAVSLRVPARTAGLLLEAASRIQSSSSARLPRKRSLGSGFLGLILKRFARRKSKTARFEQNGDDDEPSHVETASSGGGHGLENDVEGKGAVCNENPCESSLPPVTQDCTSPVGRSPEFASPKHFGEGSEEEADHRLNGKKVHEEQEEREQFSPVSVLDPLFEEVDDDDEDADSQVVDQEDDGDVGDVGFNYDCSYAFVQRTKEQLLDKLQRFERLARLDPVELEKRMVDSDDEQSITFDDTTATEHEDGHVAEHENGGVNKRVESREESWTMDVMMVDKELRGSWKPEEEQYRMIVAKEIEVGMLESLVEELTMETDLN